MFPISSPRILSRIAEMGNETGNVKNTKNHTKYVVCAPTTKAYLEHTA